MKTLLAAVFAVMFVVSVSAQAGQSGLPRVNVEPGTLGYGFMQFGEAINLAFTFNQTKKARKRVQFAEKRLAVARNMVAQNKTDKAEAAMEQYGLQMAAARKTAEDAGKSGLVKSINESTQKHVAVLQEVLQHVPDQARKGIENALEHSGVNPGNHVTGNQSVNATHGNAMNGEGQMNSGGNQSGQESHTEKTSGYVASGHVVPADQ